MKNQTQARKSSAINWVILLSLILLGIAAGLGISISVRKPESVWNQIQYQVTIFESDLAGGEGDSLSLDATKPQTASNAQKPSHRNLAARRATLVTINRTPAVVNFHEQLRMDFVPFVSKQSAENELTIYQGKVVTHHRFTLKDGETRWIPLSRSHDGSKAQRFAAITLNGIEAKPVLRTRIARPKSTAIPSK